MVIVGNLSFPFSKTNLNVLIGTLNVPYHSQSTAGYKTAFLNCPISMYLNFTKYTPQTMGITVVSQSGANIQVYKNGVFLTTTGNNGYTGVNISKQFILNNLAGNVTCNFNSYYYQVGFQYTPPQNINVGTTDIYTFYAQINYTVSSTVTPLTYVGNNPINYIIDVNTTTSTSSFTNFSYGSGSADTAGYSVYSFTNQPTYAYAWDGSQAPSYQPTITDPKLWTGLYQLAVLYANQIFTGSGIIMKNTGFTNTLSWYDSDANGSNYQTLLYASNLSNAFKIDMNASNMTNGFVVTGGRMTINEPTSTPASATNGTLQIKHGTSGGSSSIVFQSTINAGSDYGYIQFDDNRGSGGESNKLTIGTQNDPDDDIYISPSGSLFITSNICYANNVSASQYLGTVKAQNGYLCKQGTGGGYSNVYNWYWTGSSLQAWIDTSNVGTVCDYRIKENIKSTLPILNRLCSIQMFDFTHREISICKNNGNHIGLYAHELQEVFEEYPCLVTGKKDEIYENGEIKIQSIEMPILNMILMKAIQEQNEIIKSQQEEIKSLKNSVFEIKQFLNLE
jgi:hypothetical protein